MVLTVDVEKTKAELKLKIEEALREQEESMQRYGAFTVKSVGRR